MYTTSPKIHFVFLRQLPRRSCCLSFNTQSDRANFGAPDPPLNVGTHQQMHSHLHSEADTRSYRSNPTLSSSQHPRHRVYRPEARMRFSVPVFERWCSSVGVRAFVFECSCWSVDTLRRVYIRTPRTLLRIFKFVSPSILLVSM